MSSRHGNFQSSYSPWRWQWCSRLTCLLFDISTKSTVGSHLSKFLRVQNFITLNIIIAVQVVASYSNRCSTTCKPQRNTRKIMWSNLYYSGLLVHTLWFRLSNLSVAKVQKDGCILCTLPWQWTLHNHTVYIVYYHNIAVCCAVSRRMLNFVAFS